MTSEIQDTILIFSGVKCSDKITFLFYICLFMLQRVNPLVPNKLQNINRRIYPSEYVKKKPFRLLRQPLQVSV